MKKFLLSLNLILALFFTVQAAYCEENFLLSDAGNSLYIGSPYYETKNKITYPTQKNTYQPPQKNENKVETTEKKGLFSIFSKNKKNKKYNYQSNKNEDVPTGYKGTLPDINRDFNYKKQQSTSTNTYDGKIPEKEDLQPDNLKEAPFDDALFLDVIIKKEKTSNYVNDIQKTKYALNNLKKCIEDDSDIQHFNGCVNMLDLYAKNLKTKYENSSDSLRGSYLEILNTSYHSKIVGNLLYDSNYYSRYAPTQQGKYSEENIESQKRDLLNKINKTLFAIANES